MAVPSSTDELFQRLRRSGLIPTSDLEPYLSVLPTHLAPKAVLDKLVADQMLTPFQAERLGAGKYKGFLLGGYIILDKIGSGGMGQVYLAEHTAMRRLVAVKVLNIPVAEDSVAKERFFREARAAAVLNHPNIVRVFDLNREGQLPYLVMEYVEGLSLQTLVTRAGALDPMMAADYARQVALGLQHAHEKGLVHRDIKPGNLLVDRAGVARLLDLGLVRSMDEDAKLTTQIGGGRSILGTADYLAPEQAVNSSDVDTRADVYSLGATLYFMIAGHPIFPEGRTAQKLMWQQWKDPTPIRQLKPDLSEELANIVHKSIEKKPEARFQTPQEMADALATVTSGKLFPPPADLIPVPPTRRWTAGSLARSGDAGPASSGSSSMRVGSKSGDLSKSSGAPTPSRMPNPGVSAGITPAPRPAFGPTASNPLPLPNRTPPPPRTTAPGDTPHMAGGANPTPSTPQQSPFGPIHRTPSNPAPPPRTPELPVLPDWSEPPQQQPQPGMLQAPAEWKKRQVDPEDIILGSVGFMTGPTAGAYQAGSGGIIPQQLPQPVPQQQPQPQPAPVSKPFPWIAVALAFGMGVGIAVVALLANR